jgi:GDPmannose 4,6-dehydratase
LFNHESPRRGEKFVTRKITKWIGDYVKWRNKPNVDKIIVDEDKDYILSTDEKFPKLRLGNLDAYRDWGHAKDYVRAMWMMMQHDIPDDYVVSTCESHTVREFLEEAFYAISYDGNWEDLVVIDSQFYRPAEVDYLNGVSIKARTALGWTPEYAFEDLVAEMVEEDL